MNSQHPNQKARKVEDQGKSSIGENTISKSTHNQNGTLRKQNMQPAISTTDSSIGNRIYSPTVLSSPNKPMVQQYKPQDINNNRHLKSLPIMSDINEDQNHLLSYHVPHMMNRISPNSGKHEFNNDNGCYSYNPQQNFAPFYLSQQHAKQLMPMQSNIYSNNRYSGVNRQNSQNNFNKKSGNSNYSLFRKPGSNSDKKCNSNNNNNIDKNNNNEYKNTNTSAHLQQQVQQIQRGFRINNGDKTKSSSPLRDSYSSSSSSSSSSSVQLSKKRESRPATTTYDRVTDTVRRSDHQRNSYSHYEPIQYYDIPPQYTPDYTLEYPADYSYDTVMAKPRNFHRNSLSRNKTNRGNRKFTLADQYANRSEIKDPPHSLNNGSEWDQLSNQIWKKFTDSQQTYETFISKMRMWMNLKYVVNEHFSGLNIYVVGSTMSGFGSHNSDVDMCLVHHGVNHISHSFDIRSDAAKTLQSIKDVLQTREIYKDCNLITAKVPILRFKDTFHKHDIDLNYNNPVGVHNTHLLYCYTQMDWRLRPMGLVIKLWAQFHNINSAKEKSISSYSLILMVINFLQCGVKIPVLPCLHQLFADKFEQKSANHINNIDMNEVLTPQFSQNRQTLGELFLQFFEYYTYFDFSSYALSVRQGSIIPIDVCRQYPGFKNDPSQWKELCIEEPFDRTNTAHSCYDAERFECIKRVFAMSYKALRDTKDLNSIFDKPFLPPPPA